MTQTTAGLGMRKGRVAIITGVAVSFAVGGWLWWWSAKAADLDSMERIIRKRYPEVRQISTQELSDWLRSTKAKPVLLDVRGPAEYAVSHLPGARQVDPGIAPQELGGEIPKDAPIVTYCSVGWRSSGFAQKLSRAGYKNVQNLEGSIFRWANEDRPIVRDGKATEKVHPYSAYWSRLVKPEKRAEIGKTDR